MPSSSSSTAYALIIVTIFSFAGTWVVWIWNDGFAGFQDAIAAGQLPDGIEAGLQYSGFKFLDDNLRRFVFMIMPVVAHNSEQALWGRPLFTLSVVDLGSMFFVLLLEADRRGRRSANWKKQSLWTCFWLIGVANVSLAVVAPIYALAYLPSLAAVIPQKTSPSKASTAIDFLTIAACIACPCLLLLDPWQQGPIFQSTWLAALGAFPGTIPLLREVLQILSRVIHTSTQENVEERKHHHTSETDRLFTQKVVFISAMLASLVRGVTIVRVLFDKHISLWDLFIPSMDEIRGVDGYARTCLTFMKFDYALSVATLLLIARYVLAARFPDRNLFLLLGICMAFTLLGAGGVLLFVWALRESWVVEGVLQ